MKQVVDEEESGEKVGWVLGQQGRRGRWEWEKASIFLCFWCDAGKEGVRRHRVQGRGEKGEELGVGVAQRLFFKKKVGDLRQLFLGTPTFRMSHP